MRACGRTEDRRFFHWARAVTAMSEVGPMSCPSIQPTGSRGKRWFVRVVIVALLLVATGIGVCAYIGFSTSIHAEKALHAVNAVTVVVVPLRLATARAKRESPPEQGPTR